MLSRQTWQCCVMDYIDNVFIVIQVFLRIAKKGQTIKQTCQIVHKNFYNMLEIVDKTELFFMLTIQMIFIIYQQLIFQSKWRTKRNFRSHQFYSCMFALQGRKSPKVFLRKQLVNTFQCLHPVYSNIISDARWLKGNTWEVQNSFSIT